MSKKIQATYTRREVVEIILAMTQTIIERLEEGEPIVAAEVAPPTTRGYRTVGTRTPEKAETGKTELGRCSYCNTPKEPSMYPPFRPYCVPCWQAKQDRN